MKFTKFEKPLFFLNGRLVYPVLGAVLFLSGGLLFTSCLAAVAGVELISYVSNQTGNFDIHLMGINGEYLDNLTNHPANEFDPTWSPDGRFLGYVSNREGNFEIDVMDTRTKEHRRLTHAPGTDACPAWSPDGRWIAFISERRGRLDIYKMDTHGKNIRRLTRIGNNWNPAWSPDAQSIVFFRQRDNPRKFGLYVMTSEGRGVRLFLPPRLRGVVPIAWDAGYTWAPDGKQIAFGTWELQIKPPNLAFSRILVEPAEGLPRLGGAKPERVLEGAEPNALFPVTLSVFDIDAENFRKLTQVPPIGNRQHPPVPQISRPAWSLDGHWIAYSLSDAGKMGAFSAALHVINVNVCSDFRAGRILPWMGWI